MFGSLAPVPQPSAQALQNAYNRQALSNQNALSSSTGGTGGGGSGSVWITNSVGTAATSSIMTSCVTGISTIDDTVHYGRNLQIADGQECKIELPDGTVIDVKSDGSYSILDDDAKIIYRANRIREFNKFVNASDLLEKFIEYCGDQGVVKEQMMDQPLRNFIGWLMTEAALADGEEAEHPQLLLPAPALPSIRVNPPAMIVPRELEAA
jgi:hypothetical protein